MSELFGNPEQVSELSGNPEQLPYTPTTEEVRNGYVGAGSEPNPYVSEDERAEFDRWLAEVKAQAWEQGATTIVATIVMNGSNDMPRNPYRQGEAND